jgi:hypothetical protein
MAILMCRSANEPCRHGRINKEILMCRNVTCHTNMVGYKTNLAKISRSASPMYARGIENFDDTKEVLPSILYPGKHLTGTYPR